MAVDELDVFINGILDDKKLSGLDDEVRAQLVYDLRQRLLDQINRAVVAELPEDILSQLDVAMDSADVSEEQVQRMIVDSGVDVKRITVESMLRFRDLYLGTGRK